MQTQPRTSGFTLTEMIVAVGISGMVMAFALSGISHAARQTHAGASQVRFTAAGRLAAQKIRRCIEAGKAVGLSSNGLHIVNVDLTCGSIFLRDGDGNPATVADNELVFDANVEEPGDETRICSWISSIPGVPMFSVASADASTARMRFHVGDGTGEVDRVFSGTGDGYQGIEVRVSATPRNLQRWYD